MNELERDLRRLAVEIEYPPAPALARTVAERLAEDAAPRPAAPRRRHPAPRMALLAAALVLLLTGTVFAAVPGARHAVLDLLGLRGATVERIETLPAGTVARPGTGLGQATTLAAARPLLAFEPLLPAGLGRPNGVYVLRPPHGGQLTLTYPPGPRTAPRSRFTGVGLLLNEVRGDFAPGFYGKMVPPGVRIERLRIGGRPAIWVQGLHRFQWFDRGHGYFRTDRARLAAATLLYQHGRVLVRIEGGLSLAEARRIALSLR